MHENKGDDSVSLKKLCPKCGKIIDAGQRYCPDCQKIYKDRQKERHRIYKHDRTDIKEQRLYASKEWWVIKKFITSKYNGLCLWSYYVDNRIVPMNAVHHIEPVKDNWGKRLDIYNLIPLCSRAHEYVHKLYDSDKEGTQEMLKDLIWKWNKIKKMKD